MKTNANTPPEPAKGRLGTDRCGCCGRPPAVVGPLVSEDGFCRYCAHEVQLYDILADELTAVVADWVQACRDRGVSDLHIHDAFSVAEDRALKRAPEAARA